VSEGRWPGEPNDEAADGAEAGAGEVEERFALGPLEDDSGEVSEVSEEAVEDATAFAGIEPDEELSEDTDEEPLPLLRSDGHAPGQLDFPEGVSILEGSAAGGRRGVGIVASRFNGEITNSLLASAFAELERAGVAREAITVMPVPGAFELPLGAMALAKTRRYSCIVALGCVIRGETAHFDYVAGEAASGLQLASLETGVPVAFGLLTVDTIEQARARVDKGAEAVRTALEMADVFAQLRAAAAAAHR